MQSNHRTNLRQIRMMQLHINPDPFSMWLDADTHIRMLEGLRSVHLTVTVGFGQEYAEAMMGDAGRLYKMFDFPLCFQRLQRLENVTVIIEQSEIIELFGDNPLTLQTRESIAEILRGEIADTSGAKAYIEEEDEREEAIRLQLEEDEIVMEEEREERDAQEAELTEK
ncbi:MAG: hypothetical protein Q9169_003978 [Polycauliona sp. 2 TL-2023]